jgi:CHASE2 domain-containing sensor protein
MEEAMNTTPVRDAGPTITTRNKVGLAIAGLISLANVPSVFESQPAGEVGPPMTVLVLDTLLGVIGLVAVVVAWRTASRTALRVTAACLVIAAVTALPALFVDVPAFIKIAVAVFTVITMVALVLMFSGDRQRQPVLD